MMNIAWRRYATISVALLASATLLAGCAGKPRDSSSRAGELDLPSAAEPATTDVDSITWNLSGGEPATLDPGKAFSSSDLQVGANVCESLMAMTETGEIQPGLASSIDQPSETEYIVHLRENVTFSDGTPMTSDDVVFSLNRIRDPDAGSYWGYFAERVESVSAVDPSTVSIVLSQPDAVFYRMLVTPLGQVVQKAFVEKAGAAYGTPDGGVMCTGPYTLASWNPGESITLEANDKWWNSDQRPLRTKSAVFTFLTDDATISSALLNGDIDGTTEISSTILPQLLNAPNGEVYAGPSTKQFVMIPTDLSPESASALADPLIRQALAKSIDYQGLLSTVFAGLSRPIRTIVPPGAWGYSKDVYQAAYDEYTDPVRDIDAAKALLAEAGEPNPKIVLAVPADFPQYVTIGESIQSNAKEAGIEIDLRSLPSAEANALYSDPAARSAVDAFLTDYFSDIPDPTELYMQIGALDGASNFNGYDNAQVADLLEQARGAADDNARAKLTVEAQAIITEDLAWIPIAYPLQTAFLNNRLGGMTASFPAALYSPWLSFIGGR